MLQEILTDPLNVQKGKNVVFFYTPFCGTCAEARNMLFIALQAMSAEVPSFSCNLNLLPDFAKKWKIRSVPCLILFEDSVIKEKIYAFQSVTFLFDIFSRYV